MFLFPLILFALLDRALQRRDLRQAGAVGVLLAGMLGYGAANTAFAGLAIITRRAARDRESSSGSGRRRCRRPSISSPCSRRSSSCSRLEALALFAARPRRARVDSLAEHGSARGCPAARRRGVRRRSGSRSTASIRSAEGSSAIVNIIVLPMAFLSGAFGPTPHYPQVLQAIGDVLPLKYLIRPSGRDHLRPADLGRADGDRRPRRVGVVGIV